LESTKLEAGDYKLFIPQLELDAKSKIALTGLRWKRKNSFYKSSFGKFKTKGKSRKSFVFAPRDFGK
jgi:hypothetical protein